jgi:hypothetical protein
VLDGQWCEMTKSTLLVVSGTFVVALGNCGPGDASAQLPPVHQPKVTACNGPCDGEVLPALCTYPEIVSEQSMLDDACTDSALPMGDGSLAIKFDLSATGIVTRVRLPTHLSPSASACLRAWASGVAFSAALDCDGKAIPTTATVTMVRVHGRGIS